MSRKTSVMGVNSRLLAMSMSTSMPPLRCSNDEGRGKERRAWLRERKSLSAPRVRRLRWWWHARSRAARSPGRGSSASGPAAPRSWASSLPPSWRSLACAPPAASRAGRWRRCRSWRRRGRRPRGRRPAAHGAPRPWRAPRPRPPRPAAAHARAAAGGGRRVEVDGGGGAQGEDRAERQARRRSARGDGRQEARARARRARRRAPEPCH